MEDSVGEWSENVRARGECLDGIVGNVYVEIALRDERPVAEGSAHVTSRTVRGRSTAVKGTRLTDRIRRDSRRFVFASPFPARSAEDWGLANAGPSHAHL